SQPAVSKSVADIEYTLGAPLLDRTPYGVELTPYGHALIKRSVAAFDELRQSVTDIEAMLDPTAGEVRLGSTGPLSGGIVPAVVEKLNRRYPRISFQVVTADLTSLQHALRDRNVEFAVGRAPAPISDENMESEVLFNDRLLVVAGPRNKWMRRRGIKLAELMHEPWILPPLDSVAASLIAATFRAGGVDAPRPTVSSDNGRLSTYLLASGRFLTVLPESMVRLSSKHIPIKVLPVDMPVPSRPVLLVMMKEPTLRQPAEQVN